MRMPRTFTIANSAATKKALAASSRTISSDGQQHRWSGRGRRRGGSCLGRSAASGQRIGRTEQARSSAGSTSVAGERLADAAQQDEAEAAALRPSCRGPSRRRIAPGRRGRRRRTRARIGRQADRREMRRGCARASAGGHRPEPRPRARRPARCRAPPPRRAAAPRHSPPAPLGMAEGMAEVEQRAGAGLALVGRHQRRLGAAAVDDRVLLRRGVARQQRGAVRARARRRNPAGRSGRT